MDPQGIMLSEVKQRKDKYHDFTYMCNKKKINTKNRNKLTDTENKLTVARQEGNRGLGEKGEEVQMGSYKVVTRV